MLAIALYKDSAAGKLAGPMEEGISSQHTVQGQSQPDPCPFLCSFDDIDLPSAVKYLMASDPNLQVLGAAYIQHRCYNDAGAKKQVAAPTAHP